MTDSHLYKHEANRKRIVASVKHTPQDTIYLQDEDETFHCYSDRESFHFAYNGKIFLWDRSTIRASTPLEFNSVGRFHKCRHAISKLGSVTVDDGLLSLEMIFITLFKARRWLITSPHIVLSLLVRTEDDPFIASRDISTRRERENEMAIGL